MAVETTQTPQVKAVDPTQTKQWLDQGEAILVDVREPMENRQVRIEAASLCPLSDFDPEQIEQPPDTKIIFHCKSGTRSTDAARRFVKATGHAAWYLEGGIEAWQRENLPVAQSQTHAIDLQRQVQLTIGILLVTFSTLAWFVSPWFILGTAFIGLGLINAGATGTCGMAMMIAKMPWNRVSGEAAPRTCAPRT